jgi:PIN domain nuclease of toxin-antitoxin system
VKLLLDTQILLWAAGQPERFSGSAHRHLSNPDSELLFSAASLWEIAIKKSLGAKTFVSSPGCCAAVRKV